MKILVCIKRVIDFNVRVQIDRAGTGVVTDGVKMSINPFDEIAIEAALRIRESDTEVSEVAVVSIGTESCHQQLRTALAMGADRAIHISCDDPVPPLYAARLLDALRQRETPELILLGKQAIDDDCNQTGQMLAALWQRPQATFTSGLSIDGEVLRCVREVDAGLETIEVDLPAVVTTDLRLNQPRYVKMPDIMKAKRKPLDVIDVSELGVEPPPALTISAYGSPAGRAGGAMVKDVPALVAALRERGVL